MLHGLRVFLDVLEHQAVEALVELTVEVHLDQAEEQHNARGHGQPQAEEAAGRHGPGTEYGQQQRNAQVHHHPQVEAQAVEETFRYGRAWRIADHVAVVGQQCKPHQTEHEHDRHAAQQGVEQV
jgi:hypothetical protein